MSDSKYPFSLRGTTEVFRGKGRSDGEAVPSREFTLSKGIVIADVDPYPDDDFVLKIVPAEGLTKEGAIALSGGGGLAGMIAGSAIGSVVPVAGTIVGGAIGGIAGLLAVKGHNKIKPRIWEPRSLDAELVNSDYEYGLREGKHRLIVESRRRWRIKLIQPDIGQSDGPLLDAFEAEDWNSGGFSILGPYQSGSRPIRANIQHLGEGWFAVFALSVDGTHRCPVYDNYDDKDRNRDNKVPERWSIGRFIKQQFADNGEKFTGDGGQFVIEGHQTGIVPGKEYMLYVVASGGWKMELTEAY